MESRLDNSPMSVADSLRSSSRRIVTSPALCSVSSRPMTGALPLAEPTRRTYHIIQNVTNHVTGASQ